MLGLAAVDELSSKVGPLSKTSPITGDGRKKVNQIIKDKRKIGKGESSENWPTEDKIMIGRNRVQAPLTRETWPIRSKGYIGGVREELKFAPQKRMQLNFENEILGFYI